MNHKRMKYYTNNVSLCVIYITLKLINFLLFAIETVYIAIFAWKIK
jgi:hypothetical protein